MQLYFQAFSTVVPRAGERPILTPDPWPGFSIGLSNCRPTSRGEIGIRSADPFVPPRIVPNAFSTDADVAEMLAGVKFLRKLASMPAMAEAIAEEMLPGPACRTTPSWRTTSAGAAARSIIPSSTCRMGPDPTAAVVDSRLRVHGIGGLRVIDASVFPNNVGGNTNAAAIMTGAKGAAMVLEDQRLRRIGCFV